MDFNGTERLLLLGAAFFMDAANGYPNTLYRKIGHPVTWLGALIAFLDRILNKSSTSDETRRQRGVFALILIIAAAATAAVLVTSLAAAIPIFGFIVIIFAVGALLAARSLNDHVADVADALEDGGLEAGRKMVSRIVGRDPNTLDEAGVSRAAIESLAENFSDGVTAPAFWFAFLGLPGIAIYKAVNTADSMIGHKTERHLAFGWASAKLDDLLNLPASRLTALFLIIAAALTPSASAREAWAAVRRDAKKHRSPNAGWPEAAMAGALGLQLAGPRSYNGEMINDAVMGDGRRDATAEDIDRALRLYRLSVVVGLVLTVLPAFAWFLMT